MSGTTWEVLDLVARWIHVIAGIMWIGNSLLFNWLDRSLVPAQSRGQTQKPVGTIWLLHSGGFYYVEKTLLEGERLPAPLHWFKWQAYTTWMSGILLLVVVYYAGGRASLEDPSVTAISHANAIWLGVSALVFGQMGYQSAQQLSERFPRAATASWIILLSLIAWYLTSQLSGRAAFLHVGAMLGTIMAANVNMTIVPSQRALVTSVESAKVDTSLSARAKRVSIHNNYFTFPVIVLMLSSHFPAVYGSQHKTLLLFVLIGAGVLVRHILNIRWTFPSWKPTLAGAIAASILTIWGILHQGVRPSALSAASTPPPHNVSFADARHIIDRRCAVCHSERPTDSTFGKTPAGVMFDTPEQIIARASRIRERAYITATMPPGNKTGITEQERAILGAWAANPHQ